MKLFVLTFYQSNYEDPPDYDVMGVFTTLELAKAGITDWQEEDGVHISWGSHSHHTITPVELDKELE